jgi:hypothetical protein
MVRLRALVSAVPLLFACSGTAALAGDLSLEIKDGRVTLVAENVTVRQILAEWARVGQTRIVNGDRVSGGPLSLRLDGVPEARALDTLLRGVAGYMAAPRPADQMSASLYDRILIMPTSSAPPTSPATPAQRQPTPFPQPPVPAPVPVEPVEETAGDENPQQAPFAPFNAPRPQEFEPGNTPFRRAPGMGVAPGYQGPVQVPGGTAPVQTAPQPFFGTTGRPGEIPQPPTTQVPGAPGVVPGVARPGQVAPPVPPVPQQP